MSFTPENDISPEEGMEWHRLMTDGTIPGRIALALTAGRFSEKLDDIKVYTLKPGSESVDPFTKRVALSGTWRILDDSPANFQKAVFDLVDMEEGLGEPSDPALLAYHCETCGGWVHGEPNFERDLGQGTPDTPEIQCWEFRCRLCNQSLGSGARPTTR